MNTTQSGICLKVRDLVHSIDPDAEVILYGSYARGDALPDSDIDILVITSGPLSWDDEQNMRSRVYRYEVESDSVFSLVIHSNDEWHNPLFMVTPFYKNVTSEGIRI